MNFTTHNDDIRMNGGGTGLQGYVTVPYKKLVKIFGEPLDGDGYKVDAEWIITFEDGTVATIYNYKDGKNYNGSSGMVTNRITEWHIGGADKRAVTLVQNVLGL